MKFRRTLTSFTSLHKNAGYSFHDVPACPLSHDVNRIKVIQSFKNLIIAYVLHLSIKVDLMSK